jgi:hypothetical protein
VHVVSLLSRKGNLYGQHQKITLARAVTAFLHVFSTYPVYEQRGEFSAAVELRRLFPAVTDTAQARACVRTIAGWKPLPVPLGRRTVRLPDCGTHD